MLKTTMTCLLLVGVCLSWTAVAQETIPSQTGPYFGVGIEQNGRAIPIEDHQVTLERSSFLIVLIFPGQESILVNASVTPDTYEAARTDQPLAGAYGFSDLGMAEEAFNPRALLMLSTQAPHFWYYAHEGDHRFNDVARQNNAIICRRIIANLMYRDVSKQITSLRDMAEDSLYLVFLKTRWTSDFKQQIEQQRDYLQINFR